MTYRDPSKGPPALSGDSLKGDGLGSAGTPKAKHIEEGLLPLGLILNNGSADALSRATSTSRVEHQFGNRNIQIWCYATPSSSCLRHMSTRLIYPLESLSRHSETSPGQPADQATLILIPSAWWAKTVRGRTPSAFNFSSSSR